MQVTNQEFKDGVLVREEIVDVPDAEPTPEEVAAAKVATLEARVVALTSALEKSGSPELQAVAAEIKKVEPVDPKAEVVEVVEVLGLKLKR